MALMVVAQGLYSGGGGWDRVSVLFLYHRDPRHQTGDWTQVVRLDGRALIAEPVLAPRLALLNNSENRMLLPAP